MEVRFLLLESAMGYAVFDRKESDEIGAELADAQKATPDFARFSKIVSLRGFTPFASAEDALENINDVAEGVLSNVLRSAVESNVPSSKEGKKAKAALGVGEEKIGKSIQEELGCPVVCNDLTRELLRGCRAHLSTFLKGLRSGDVERAQLGLAHSYSRCKVKFDVNRADKHIIQAIAILDTLDKDINTFAMRVREWCVWPPSSLPRLCGPACLVRPHARAHTRRGWRGRGLGCFLWGSCSPLTFASGS